MDDPDSDAEYVLLEREEDDTPAVGLGGLVSSARGGSANGPRRPLSGLHAVQQKTLQLPPTPSDPATVAFAFASGGAPHMLLSRPSSPSVTRTRPNKDDQSHAPPILASSKPPQLVAAPPHRVTIPRTTHSPPLGSRLGGSEPETGNSFVVAAFDYLANLPASDLWLAAWFCASACSPIYNKALLRGFFPCPWLLTAVQMACSSLGTLFAAKVQVYRPARLSKERGYLIYAASFLFSAEILTSNVSLKLIPVPFHLSVRALSPLVTLLLGVVFFHQHTSVRTSSCLALVLFGVAFTSHGLDFHSTGSLLAFSSMLLNSAKTIVTRELLLERYGLHPLDLQSRMATMGAIHCTILALWNGELRRVWELSGPEFTITHIFYIWMNGVLSFALFIIGWLAETRTNGASMAISSHAAQAVTTTASLLFWNLELSFTNLIGILLTLGGGITYAQSDALDDGLKERINAKTQPD